MVFFANYLFTGAILLMTYLTVGCGLTPESAFRLNWGSSKQTPTQENNVEYTEKDENEKEIEATSEYEQSNENLEEKERNFYILRRREETGSSGNFQADAPEINL